MKLPNTPVIDPVVIVADVNAAMLPRTALKEVAEVVPNLDRVANNEPEVMVEMVATVLDKFMFVNVAMLPDCMVI